MRPLAQRAFNQRRDDLLARLDRIGRTQIEDRGANRGYRRISIEVTIPGQVGEPRLPDEVHLQYEEWWCRSSLGWVRVRYNYNYVDLAHGGRWGFHLHPLPGRRRLAVPHQVCVRPDGGGEGIHFEAHEIDLLAANDEFEREYALRRKLDCGGLRRID